MTTSRSRRFVLTGGPHSGKTTLLRALAGRGYRTAPEAALRMIAAIDALLGDAAGREWRRRHAAEFQRRIALEQERLESELPPSGAEAVFLDRGMIDGLAYCRLRDVEPPDDLVRLARQSTYDRAFVLDLVVPFDRRRATGRESDEEAARRIAALIEEAYRAHGIEVTRVPLVPVDERVERILEHVGSDRF